MWVRFDVTERQDPVRAVRAGDDRGNGGLARGSRKGKGRLRLRTVHDMLCWQRRTSLGLRPTT